ncbi:hypothetical protein [Streptomyces sp. XH2]|uniref:hypothetical protein n=1 Tax=Streptomyces sp. XH2 TaxID=3412483 RepID=UPI003C7E59D4
MSVRDEVLAPFRGLPRDIGRGTPVLIRYLVRGLHAALRAALRGIGRQGSAVTPPAKGHAEAGEDQQAGTARASNGQSAGPPWKKRKKGPPTAAPVPAAGGRSLADLAEFAAIGFLSLAVAATVFGMVLGYIGHLLAPYRWGIALGLAISWCLAAAMVAPSEEDTPCLEEGDEPDGKNDHEKLVGEETPVAEAWSVTQDLRDFVEGKVAAGAAGYAEAKGKGARIDDIIAGLQADDRAPEGLDRKTMTRLLGDAGITVREQMKFRIDGNQKNQPGVHIDDLTEDLGRRPLLPAHLIPDLTPQHAPAREDPTTC